MPLTYLFTSFSVKDKPLKKIQNTYAQSTITVPIHLKSDMCDYVHSPTPHAKYGCRRKCGLGGHMDEVVPSHAFFKQETVVKVSNSKVI